MPRKARIEFDDSGLHREVTDWLRVKKDLMSVAEIHRPPPIAPSNQSLAYRQYWRDDRDRITAWKRGTVNSQNGMEDGRGDRYAYDEEGQLRTASYRAATPEGTPSGALRLDSFTYDALGNRQGWNYLANRGWMWLQRRDNGLNQYHSWENQYPDPPQHWGSGIFHDDTFGPPTWVPPGNGVVMADGWIVASYNALNQPVAIGSIGYGSNYLWFGYDPLGRCVKRWVGTATGNAIASNPATYFYYDGWNLVQEGPNASTAGRIYVHGGRVDEIVASQAGGVWNYHQYDARGHCILLTKTDGGIREQYDYDAFGFPYFYTANGVNLVASQQWGNRFLFTGREWLGDLLRLYDYRNRLYQPELGRFLQPDPKQFAAGDYNLYRYCHNDPINKSDPTGLYVSGLTSFGGGDWVGGIDGITNRERDLMTMASPGNYSSWQDAGKAGGRAHASQAHAEKREYHGKMGQSVKNGRVYTYGQGLPGGLRQHSDGRWYNESNLGEGPLPPGFKPVGAWWVLAHHQDPNAWPVHENGRTDRDELQAAHMNGVLTIPPPPGASMTTNHFDYKVYDAEHDSDSR